MLLFRESKRTKQALISIIVSENYLQDEQKQLEIEEKLKSLYKAGDPIGEDLKLVSLSIVFANDLSGGYKETDTIKILAGQDYYEEVLNGYKFRVSPFAFF